MLDQGTHSGRQSGFFVVAVLLLAAGAASAEDDHSNEVSYEVHVSPVWMNAGYGAPRGDWVRLISVGVAVVKHFGWLEAGVAGDAGLGPTIQVFGLPPMDGNVYRIEAIAGASLPLLEWLSVDLRGSVGWHHFASQQYCTNGLFGSSVCVDTVGGERVVVGLSPSILAKVSLGAIALNLGIEGGARVDIPQSSGLGGALLTLGLALGVEFL